MKLNKEKDGQTLRLFLTGELGHHEAIDMIAELKSAVALSGECGIILDLTGLTFMDSSGIAVVLRTYQSAVAQDMTFALKVPPGHVYKILTAAGLQKIIKFI